MSMLIDAHDLINTLRAAGLGIHVRMTKHDAFTLRIETGGKVVYVKAATPPPPRTVVLPESEKTKKLLVRAERSRDRWKAKATERNTERKAAEVDLSEALAMIEQLEQTKATEYLGPLNRLVIDEMYSGTGFCIRRAWEPAMSLCGRTEVARSKAPEQGMSFLCGTCADLKEAVECAQRIVLPRLT